MAPGNLAFIVALSMAGTWPAVVAPAVNRAGAPSAAQKPAPPPSASPPDEVMVIDGSKNPELIPQWSAWEFAFRVIGGGPGELPTSVHRVVSTEERALILAEAQASLRRDKACQARIEKLVPLIGKESNAAINAKQREIQLDCRWETIRARDLLLQRLRPEGQTELIGFVEATKAGTTVTMPKRELAHYLQPQ